MTTAPSHSLVAEVSSLVRPEPPHWVCALLAGRSSRTHSLRSPVGAMRITESGPLALLSLHVHQAVKLDDESFRRATQDAYGAVLDQLHRRRLWALRYWNYVPDIGRAADAGFTRYEVFSSGRFATYREWYEGAPFEKHLRPATAVGHRGNDLVIHVLAGEQPGSPIENPRQRPAYQYSQRYGPCPPSFARALRLDALWSDDHVAPLGIISGTASIVGEDSTHLGDVGAQLDEICTNLAALSVGICGEPEPVRAQQDGNETLVALERYRELRVYLVDPNDGVRVQQTIGERFIGLDVLELVSADLCRRELRIEIEGILRDRDATPNAGLPHLGNDA